MYREARDRQARIAASISWHMIKKKEVGNTQRNKMVGCVVEMRKRLSYLQVKQVQIEHIFAIFEVIKTGCVWLSPGLLTREK